MVSDVVSCGEPKAFQQVIDIIQVTAPSSIMVRKEKLLSEQTVICNASWCERQGSLWSTLKEIMFDSEG